ncbi:hypothetical protein POM88_027029 [Heracleum sosnowskyi]|uniref:Condensin-2 complex subunit H2 n=1 Tax=Heracleum sosnowskyi TaxID=360622 RepID=A0AAD8I7U2_9APIA|nr:hypothetical protein POM88_027029 [Heracleum sosnowskyi]
MSRNGEKSSSCDHANEIHHCDKEFDSILNVIRKSNMDPYKICLKRIIGELPVRDAEFDSVEKFKKRLVEICNEEINEDFINMDFDLLSKCCKEIINTNYGSINFDKAALLLESSAKVYSSKVDHLHSLVTQAAKNAKKRSQPEQTEEDDFWVPDDIEVDPNCTLSPDDTTASLINFVKPPADLVLDGDGLDATGDGETLESYSLAKSVLYRDFLLLDPCDTAAVDEYLKGQVDVRKGKHGGDKGSSQSSKSSDGRYPADGGYPVPRIVHEDDSAHCHSDSSGHENPVPDAKIEEYLHPLLDSSLANINESEEQTEMAARVSLWKQKIKQDLEEHEARPAFDVNDHGKKVLQKLSESGDLENKVPFADVVLGEEKHDVARSFSAVLHLANNDNIDLQKSDTDDEEVMSASPFTVKFLRLLKRQPEPEVQFQSSKRRAVSQTNKGESKDMRGSSGKENCEP